MKTDIQARQLWANKDREQMQQTNGNAQVFDQRIGALFLSKDIAMRF